MSRKKITIQARELSDMDVSRVSLVKRGANRIPFRIVKSDGESKMSLNLSNLFLRKRDAVPSVLAVILQKDVDVEVYKTALAEAGFEVVSVDEGEEANTLLFSADEMPEDISLFKVSDDAALVVEGIQKGIQTFPDSNSFVENITGAGFVPSFRVAHQILGETIGNIVFSEGEAEMTKSEISKAIADFGVYVESVMSTIPEQAFKAEEVVLTVEKGLLNEQDTADSLKQKAKDAKKTKAKAKAPAKDAKKADADDDDAEDEEISADVLAITDDPEKQKAIAAIIAVKDDEGEDDDAGADDDAGDDDAGEDDAGDDDATGDDDEANVEKDDKGKTADDDDDKIAALQKSLEATIAAAMAPVTEAIAGVKQELSDRLDGVEEKVKKTDEALKGSVNSEEADDDSTPAKKSDKPEEVNWDNVLDFGDVEIS